MEGSSPYRPWMTEPEGESAAESLADSLGGVEVRSMACADETGFR